MSYFSQFSQLFLFILRYNQFFAVLIELLQIFVFFSAETKHFALTFPGMIVILPVKSTA